MSTAINADADRPVVLPNQLVSPRAKLVYLYLVTVDGANLDELHETLREPLLSLYKILTALIECELVVRFGDYFQRHQLNLQHPDQ